MEKNNLERLHWKYKIAAVILTLLFIATFLSIVSLRATIYLEPGNFDFHNIANKITRFLKQNNSVDVTKYDSIRVKMVPIESAISVYLLNTGEYPETLNDLIIDPKLPGWAGPYLKTNQLLDTWSRPYFYVPRGHPNGGHLLICYGADGLPGGSGYDADIYND